MAEGRKAETTKERKLSVTVGMRCPQPLLSILDEYRREEAGYIDPGFCTAAAGRNWSWSVATAADHGGNSMKVWLIAVMAGK
jgi:hypothetical protein